MYIRFLISSINPTDQARTRASVIIARAAIAGLDFANLAALRVPPEEFLDDEAMESQQRIAERLARLHEHLRTVPSLRWHEYEAMRLLRTMYAAGEWDGYFTRTCQFVSSAAMFRAQVRNIPHRAFHDWACAVIAAVHEGREVPPAPAKTGPVSIPSSGPALR